MLSVVILHVVMLSVLLNAIDDCSFYRVWFCWVSLCRVLFCWRDAVDTEIREYKKGKYHCTIDLLFDWFGLACFANKNKKLSVVLQLIPNQSNWRSTVQWYFPLEYSLQKCLNLIMKECHPVWQEQKNFPSLSLDFSFHHFLQFNWAELIESWVVLNATSKTEDEKGRGGDGETKTEGN